MDRQTQKGVTLVVSLIMLVVLTLLVVSAIRFGSINLKIASNAQAEVEASAATMVAIEKQIEAMNLADKIDTVPAQPALVVATGGKNYTVKVSKPYCVLSSSVVTTQLNPANAADRACIGNTNFDPIFDKDGNPIPQPTECKNQQWDVAAEVNDLSSGAKLEMVQGVSLRVDAKVQCPS
jgi:competence protein ComGC